MLYYKYNEMSGRGQMAKENRNFKDSVFTDLFCSDKYAKRNLLDLYNALYGESLHDENVLEQVRLENVLFKNFQNDIAFLVGNKKIIIPEKKIQMPIQKRSRRLVAVQRQKQKTQKMYWTLCYNWQYPRRPVGRLAFSIYFFWMNKKTIAQTNGAATLSN